MLPFFLTGPLAEEPLRSFLLDGLPVETRPATLDRATLAGSGVGGLPGLRPVEGQRLHGVRADGGGDDLRARLAALNLVTQKVALSDGRDAQLPAANCEASDAWDAHNWRQRFAPLFREAIADLHTEAADPAPPNAGARLTMILARAGARLSGAARNRSEGRDLPDRGAVELLARTCAHRGFFDFDILRLRHRQFSGAMGGEIAREVFVACEAALVLPYDPLRDEVLLVEQFRAGAFVAGDSRPWTLEPVAGLVDPGEMPETTALREAVEEAGLVIDLLEPVGGAYPSPGTSSEYYHLFVGLADFSAIGPGGGVGEEGEDIRTHRLSFAEFSGMARAGRLDVLPLLTLALWLEINRARLRTGIATPGGAS